MRVSSLQMKHKVYWADYDKCWVVRADEECYKRTFHVYPGWRLEKRLNKAIAELNKEWELVQKFKAFKNSGWVTPV